MAEVLTTVPGRERLSLTGWFHGPMPQRLLDEYKQRSTLVERCGGIERVYGPSIAPTPPITDIEV